MAYMRLGDLLISVGLITKDQLDHALEVQKTTHKRLGAVLIDEGIISEQHLIETMQLQLGIDYIDLTKVHIPVELASVLGRLSSKCNRKDFSRRTPVEIFSGTSVKQHLHSGNIIGTDIS